LRRNRRSPTARYQFRGAVDTVTAPIVTLRKKYEDQLRTYASILKPPISIIRIGKLWQRTGPEEGTVNTAVLQCSRTVRVAQNATVHRERLTLPPTTPELTSHSLPVPLANVSVHPIRLIQPSQTSMLRLVVSMIQSICTYAPCSENDVRQLITQSL